MVEVQGWSGQQHPQAANITSWNSQHLIQYTELQYLTGLTGEQLSHGCDKTSTPPFFLYFSLIFSLPKQSNMSQWRTTSQDIPRYEADSTIDSTWSLGWPDLRHHHESSHRLQPHCQVIIPYSGLPMTPPTSCQQSRLAGGPVHRPDHLICAIIFHGQYKTCTFVVRLFPTIPT
jgi:hypothetical protein